MLGSAGKLMSETCCQTLVLELTRKRRGWCFGRRRRLRHQCTGICRSFILTSSYLITTIFVRWVIRVVGLDCDDGDG